MLVHVVARDAEANRRAGNGRLKAICGEEVVGLYVKTRLTDRQTCPTCRQLLSTPTANPVEESVAKA